MTERPALSLRAPAFLAWAVAAWCTPALLAQWLGWHAIWGGTAVLADYLVPVPVAGGVLHVPTFLLCAVLLLVHGQLRPALARQLSPLLLAGMLTGVLMLIDMGWLHDLLTTDMTAGAHLPRWQENPPGLFLLTDCALTWIWLRRGAGDWPARDAGRLAAVLIVAGIPALYLGVALGTRSRAAGDFTPAAMIPGPARGDGIVYVHTRRDPLAPGFDAAAAAFATTYDPAVDVDTSDMALVFEPGLEAARMRRTTAGARVLCLYEDGTPPAYLPDVDACFVHENFHERWDRISRSDTRSLPQDVRAYLALRRACAGVETGTGSPAGRAAQDLCAGLAQRRADIDGNFAGDAAVQAALAE